MTLDTTIGGITSDSYGTLAEALTYHQNYGNSAWSASGVTDPQREIAMRRAAMWVDGVYSVRWPGVREGAQSRDWPRTGALDSSGLPVATGIIPEQVKQAQFEAALRELVAPGSLTPDVDSNSVVKMEKIGPITTEYAVTEGQSAMNAVPVLSVVELILATLVAPLGVVYPAVLVV